MFGVSVSRAFDMKQVCHKFNLPQLIETCCQIKICATFFFLFYLVQCRVAFRFQINSRVQTFKKTKIKTFLANAKRLKNLIFALKKSFRLRRQTYSSNLRQWIIMMMMNWERFCWRLRFSDWIHFSHSRSLQQGMKGYHCLNRGGVFIIFIARELFFLSCSSEIT